MNGDEFPGVDLDLLADFLGGALDDTPDHDRVAALVAAEPAWGAAHATLTAGMAAVTTQLRELGAAAEPMPADVADRIAATLTGAAAFTHAPAPDLEPAAASAHPADAHPADAHPADAHPADAHPADAHPADGAGGRHLQAVPGGQPRPAQARRQRIPRWAVPTAVAAGILAVAGLTVGQLVQNDSGTATTTSDAAARPGDFRALSSGPGALQPNSVEAAPFGAPILPAAERITASGLDLRPDDLAGVVVKRSAPAEAQAEPAAGMVVAPDRVDPSLLRLTDREALLGCLEAIAAQHGQPIAAEAVEYARFQGTPAVVVRFTAGTGRWAWVSGGTCGTPAGEAATLYQAKIG